MSRVCTAVVVSDDERGLLLWVANGAPTCGLRTTDGRALRVVPFAEWVSQKVTLVPGAWRAPGILKLVPPGEAHSVWWFWRPDGVFKGWYVNLEEPGVFWDDGHLAGVDTCDQDLDIWVNPDLSWMWKDIDELTERLEFPDHYWVADPEAVWDAGRRVVRSIEVGAFPFDGSFCDFQPDPLWRIPAQLPAGWDRPRVR
jgi:Protein of unknown function (DUF402)